MNLWDRLKTIGAAICLLTFVACEDPTNLGQDLQDLKDIEIRYAEIPLETGMVRIDSVNTTNRGFLAVGEVNDPVFGKIKATSYTAISYASASKISSSAVYDSIVLSLNLSELYSIGVETQFGLEVRELLDSLKDETEYTTNSEGIPYNSELLIGQKIVSYEPDQVSKDTLLTITLDKTWGNKFFNFLKTGIDASEMSQSTFIKTVSRGLVFLPITTDGIAKINTARGYSGIKVHYHTDKDTLAAYFDLSYSNVISSTKYVRGFIKVETDRSSSVLDVADDKAEFERFVSDDTKIYSSNITGILPVLDLSNVYSFLDTLDNVQINRADIILEEVDGVSVKRRLRADAFLMYKTGDTLSINYGKALQQGSADPSGSIYPSFLYYQSDSKFYTDITSSVQGMFDKTVTSKNLVLTNALYSSTYNYFWLNNNLSRLEISGAKLGVYYTVPIKK